VRVCECVESDVSKGWSVRVFAAMQRRRSSLVKWYVVAEESKEDAIAAVRHHIGESGEQIEAVKPLSATRISGRARKPGEVAHVYVRHVRCRDVSARVHA
jgi:hypothetical protein